MPLSPYPDWLIFLRLVLPGDQIIVSNQFIFQPCAFICDKSLHLYNRLFLSATIVAGGLAEIECSDSKKAPSRNHFQDGTFLVVDQSEHFTTKPPLKKKVFVQYLFGGPKGIRTLDLSDANRTLSQLSYGPMCLTRELRALNCVWDVARVTTA